MNSIFIFRRDFRVTDNVGFNKCYKNSKNVYPIFIFTPEQIKKNSFKSNNAVQFMIESLLDLDKKINLTFYYGDYENVIKSIIKTKKINAIFTNTDYTKYAIQRDNNILKICKKYKIKFNKYHDICLLPPASVLNKTNTYYQKFTPYYNEHLKKDVDSPKKMNINKSKIKSISTKYKILNSKLKTFYKENNNITVRGGRDNVLKIVSKIGNFKTYDKTRDTLSQETTRLSAYLKFGCISIREIYSIFKKKFGVKHALIRQLIWRDFYYHLGYGYIDRFGKSLKPQYDNIKWDNNPTLFKKWCDGETGFPIVDACMKELNTSGYMHNRGRLIVSSFLIKNLQINWEKGEKYFAQNLVDYDVLVNNGNWQWASGSGADSQPYFRIFSPISQSTKHDKECKYIKKWLPNLKNIENRHLHDWEKYNHLHNLKKINYVKPIIDYSKSRDITISMYKKALVKK